MEEKLKETLGRTQEYLDFQSVINGFRDIGLVGFIEEPEIFNIPDGTKIPSFKEQIKFVEQYLKKLRPDYKLTHGWDHLYFVSKENRLEDIKEFLSKYPRPIETKEGKKGLGQLLSFPKCCVKTHTDKSTNNYQNEYSILPFAACSSKCEEPWIEEYKKLSDKYGIDISKKIINGND